MPRQEPTEAEHIDLDSLDVGEGDWGNEDEEGGPPIYTLDQLQDIPLTFLEIEERESQFKNEGEEAPGTYIRCLFAFVEGKKKGEPGGKLGRFNTQAVAVCQQLKRQRLPVQGKIVKQTSAQSGRRYKRIVGLHHDV